MEFNFYLVNVLMGECDVVSFIKTPHIGISKLLRLVPIIHEHYLLVTIEPRLIANRVGVMKLKNNPR